MRVLRVGRAALLAELEDEASVRALHADRRRPTPCRDVVPGAQTVLFDEPEDLERLERWLGDWVPGDGVAGPTGGLVEVPTSYDGPDLAEVARLWSMTEAEVVATHTGTEFTVAFCGFSPGFAYCTGLPRELATPRQARPRARVPVGSVALAGRYTGVYPTASPGGWQVVGRTTLALWDIDRDPPATLAPGTRVRFTEV